MSAGPGQRPADGRLEVGYITKPHGLRGEVIVNLVTDRVDERLAAGSILHMTGGDLEVVASRPHQGRWIVSFVGVTDRNGAEALRGTVLTAAPLDADDTDVLWVHVLIGAEVVDTTGRSHGLVESVEANPASDLLVLASGRLVPVTFVVERTPTGRVVVDAPAGLLDDDD